MKQEYKQKLLTAYNIICDSIDDIGLISHNLKGLDHPRPRLYFSHIEYKKYLKTYKITAELPDGQIPYGVCFPGAGAIYVNSTVRLRTHENERVTKYENIKRGYSDYLRILIHELVHYCFQN